MPKNGATVTPPPPSPDQDQDDGLRSLTRLVVGAADIGLEELRIRLRRWEHEIDEIQARDKAKTSPFPPGELADQPSQTEPEKDEILRYAVTGMLFDAQVIARDGYGKAVDVGKRVRRRTRPIYRPIASSRLLAPARKNYRRLVGIGQSKVDRWIEIGRQEEAHSRMLAQTALTGTIDETVDYIGDMPEVQELIAAQTTSLAGEVIEEIRERTVAVDILLEGFARALFRRRPRYKVPPPPPAVQLSAVSLRASKSNTSSTRKV